MVRCLKSSTGESIPRSEFMYQASTHCTKYVMTYKNRSTAQKRTQVPWNILGNGNTCPWNSDYEFWQIWCRWRDSGGYELHPFQIPQYGFLWHPGIDIEAWREKLRHLRKWHENMKPQYVIQESTISHLGRTNWTSGPNPSSSIQSEFVIVLWDSIEIKIEFWMESKLWQS